MNKNIEVLEEVLDVLEEEKKKIYDLIDENDFRIEQINSYLCELTKREEDNFKVFSPRNAENMHREQIATDITKKENYETENAEYQKKIEFLKDLMGKVNAVIENLQMEEKNAGQCSYVENTEQEHIAHQIMNCVSYIISDAERARVELTAIAEKIRTQM